MKVVEFREPYNADVQRAIDDFKEIVEGGQIASVAFSIVYRDGSISTGWSAARIGELLGSVGRLAHRINLGMDE